MVHVNVASCWPHPHDMIRALFTALALAVPGAHSWSYSDQASWPGHCQDGSAQSPINIDTLQLSYSSDLAQSFRCDYITNPDARFQGTVLHQDESLLVRIDDDRDSFSCHGIPFESRTGAEYRLSYLELHWGQANARHGSEHSLSGEYAAAELQLVHFNAAYANYSEASATADTLLVVSIMFAQAEKSDQSDNVVGNDALYEIASKANASLVSVPAADLLQKTGLDSERRHRFYAYKGSLTQPPCTQGVTWVIAESNAFIETPTLNLLRGLTGTQGQPFDSNIRNQMPIADRKVFASWDHAKQADDHAQLLMLIVSLIGAGIVLIATGVLAWLKFRTAPEYKDVPDSRYDL